MSARGCNLCAHDGFCTFVQLYCGLHACLADSYNEYPVCTIISKSLYNCQPVCTILPGFCTISFFIVRPIRISHTKSHLAQTSHDQPRHDFDTNEVPSTGRPLATGATWYLTRSPDAPRRAFRHSGTRGSVQGSMYHPTPSTVCAGELPNQQARYARHPIRRICPTASPSAWTCLNEPT